MRPQELAKQADSPETDSHCPDCQTWAQKGNCGIERHLPFGRRGARSPRERPTRDHGKRRVQGTWQEAQQTGKAQAHAQEQRGRLCARNRLDLPRVRGRRGRPRALARALGGASGLRQGRSEEGGQIRARRPSGSAPRAVADKARAPRKGAEPLGQKSGFQKAAAFLPPTGSNRVLPAHDRGEGASPCRRRRGLATRHARAPAHSRIVRDRRGERPAGERPAGGRPRDDPHRARISPQPPLLSARSTRIGGIPLATRLRGHSPAIGAQRSRRRRPADNAAVRAFPRHRRTALASAASCRRRGCAGTSPPSSHRIRNPTTVKNPAISGDILPSGAPKGAQRAERGSKRVETGRNRLPLFDIQRKRCTICYS